MNVGYVSGFSIDVMWILPKLVNYRKSHFLSREVVWINCVSRRVYGSTLSNCVKKKN